MFYQSVGNNTLVSVVNTTTTAVNITSGLTPGATYIFSVVSYGSESSTVLASDNSSIIVAFSK